ncbi:MAG: hypothetical protein JW776_15765 [Candidatus Lokiarchaeota archaeon]|nr:hypothetical protein [Candidatus Lokiarchaeota archaeon]
MSKNENPSDKRGVHRFRFKWRELITKPPENVKQLVMKWEDNTAKYYFEKEYEGYEGAVSLDEIVNIKILEKISQTESSFKVIGARGRNIIIGDISLTEFGIPGEKLLILSSLADWRDFSKTVLSES